MKLSKYADKNQMQLYKQFPSTHVLSSPKSVLNTIAWITFFRRNLHRFVMDYLCIKLYPYQALVMYLLGITDLLNIVGSRCIAKSFLIGLYSCCRAILYPHSEIVIASATRKQAELIISKKIEGELMRASPQLRAEIKCIKKVNDNLCVFFNNGSIITAIVANDNARGERSTVLVREENRMIKKFIDSSVLSPFQHIRSVGFRSLPEYANIPELEEEPVNIYITSSWFDNGHWMWEIADTAFNQMLKNKSQIFLAFDLSVVIEHGFKTKKQLKLEKKKIDELSWRIEYLNERVKENTSAFFNYQELSRQQRLVRPFYPRKTIDVLTGKKNPFAIPRQNGEIRIVACDMAFVEGDKNDNSIFSCMRLLPESTTHTLADKSIEISNGYHRQVPYLESIQGGDTDKQAIRIRQLFTDFEADYLVLDVRNAGLSIADRLAKVLYDEEREIEYAPITCMNDEGIANRVRTPNAQSCMFAIAASQKLNSDIAISLKTALQDNKIDLLIPYNKALEEQLPRIEEYNKAIELDDQLFYEKPYLETQEFIAETNGLLCERKEQTGVIVVSEKGANRKDRYTSISYANYFADLLEQDLLSVNSQYEVVALVN